MKKSAAKTENFHCISPGNYEVYKKIVDGKTVEVSACCGEGCNEYRLAADGRIKWYEMFGAESLKGVFDLSEIPHKGLQVIFNGKDNYTWCDCEDLRGKNCLFRDGNINKGKHHTDSLG